MRTKNREWLAHALQVVHELNITPENLNDFIKYVKDRRSLKREAKDVEVDLGTIIARMGLVTGMSADSNRKMMHSMRDLGLIVVDEDLVREAFRKLRRRKNRAKYLSAANDNRNRRCK